MQKEAVRLNDVILSIIIPIYNVAPYLERCIVSVINQTYQNMQIILVDDGSTDESASICDTFQKKDARIVVIHKKNSGLVSARKTGLQMATGEYVGYVDGDDWIEPDMYERMINVMLEHQVDMVETQHYVDAGVESRLVQSKWQEGKYTVNEVIPNMLCDDAFNECCLLPYVWSKLFRRNLLEKHQMQVNEQIMCGEDIAVVYPYVLECNTIYFSDYAGYHYVQRSNSMTSVMYEKEFVQNQALIKHLYEVFEKNEKYRDMMLRQLNQYTKSMLLVRNIGFFETNCGKDAIKPFVFGDKCKRIALYGAGRMGQGIYRYLQGKDVQVSLWADREHKMYQQLGMDVVSPEMLILRKEEYDAVMICVCSRTTADAIRNTLQEQGISRDEMIWLSEEFVSAEYDIVSLLLVRNKLEGSL